MAGHLGYAASEDKRYRSLVADGYRGIGHGCRGYEATSGSGVVGHVYREGAGLRRRHTS